MPKTKREIDKERAIALILARRAEGKTFRQIAAMLDKAGIPTLCGRPEARWRKNRVAELYSANRHRAQPSARACAWPMSGAVR